MRHLNHSKHANERRKLQDNRTSVADPNDTLEAAYREWTAKRPEFNWIDGLTPTEREVCLELIHAGYTVHRRGWPDFLAVNETGEVRLIEVTPARVVGGGAVLGDRY